MFTPVHLLSEKDSKATFLIIMFLCFYFLKLILYKYALIKIITIVLYLYYTRYFNHLVPLCQYDSLKITFLFIFFTKLTLCTISNIILKNNFQGIHKLLCLHIFSFVNYNLFRRNRNKYMK